MHTDIHQAIAHAKSQTNKHVKPETGKKKKKTVPKISRYLGKPNIWNTWK